MLKKKFLFRNTIVLLLFLSAFIAYIGILITLQVANAEDYQITVAKTTTRTFTVTALRGEIFDRNGVPLVTNRTVDSLVILGGYFNKSTMYDSIMALIDLVEKNGCKITESTLPILEMKTNTDSSAEQIRTYSYSMALSTNDNERNRFEKFLKKNKLNLNISASEFMTFLITKYKLEECPPEKLHQVVGIYYDFDYNDVWGGNNYVLSEEVNSVIITRVKENAFNMPGVDTVLSAKRVYHVPGVASHILGTIGKIYAEEWEQYKEKGYSMDAIVGKSGVEKSFEEYLRGVDGVLIKTYDENMNLLSEEWKSEPVAGNNVYLTIDIKLQELAEKSIGNTIERIHSFALREKNPEISGIDANAGSAVVLNPNNGEILALATYPTYDITMLNQIQYYNELMLNEDKPLVNRATMGRYPPGSVFKICTALAALSEHTIQPETEIEDKGIWTKFGEEESDYKPRCWLYLMAGRNHGYINVSTAIKESCNYFFFEVSEMLGITKLNEYSRKLGLGQLTGVEIGETKGILASPEYKKSINDYWTQGDLLQASIGQSYNVFSPLQIATMMSTVLNGGTRYDSHLLQSVREFHTENVILEKQPQVLDKIDITDTILNTLKKGMNEVVESGTASNLFRNFPIQVGGKTGTAQIRFGTSDYATFAAFAPYENPEITISVVIEHGAHGTYAGYVAKDIMEYYFEYRTFEEILGIEPEEGLKD